MSDMPEKIWVEIRTCTVDASGASRLLAMDREFSRGIEYRRADLPATDVQAIANPKVKALVEALCGLISYSEMGHFQTNDPVQTALDALAALEAKQ